MGGEGGGLGNIINKTPIGQLAGGDLTGQVSASNAADKQIAMAQQANAIQQQQFDATKQNAQPYMAAGQQGISGLQSGMGDMTRQFTMQDFQQDPGYQFQLNQGLQAIQRSAAAKGMLNSAGTMQNLNNYAQGTAAQDYQNAYNRFTQNQQQRYAMMSGLAGIGQNAVGQVAGQGANYANAVGANYAGMGNAGAAASMQGYNGSMSLLKSGASLAAAMG